MSLNQIKPHISTPSFTNNTLNSNPSKSNLLQQKRSLSAIIRKDLLKKQPKIFQELILEGHKRDVICLSLSPCTTFIASGSQDATVKLWSFPERKEIFTFHGHIGSVLSICFSPDTKYIASGSLDSTIKFWNLQTKSEEFSFNTYAQAVISLSFSPDGEYLASGSSDQSVKIWVVRERSEDFSISFTESVFSVEFSSNFKYLVIGFWTSITVWDFERKTEQFTYIYEQPIRVLAISKDSRYIICVFFCETSKILDISSNSQVSFEEEGMVLPPMSKQNESVVSLLYYYKEICRVFKLNQLYPTEKWGAINNAFAISPNWKFIVSGLHESILIARPTPKTKSYTLKFCSTKVLQTKLSADRKYLVNLLSNGTIDVWTRQSLSSYFLISSNEYEYVSVAFSTDFKYLACGTLSGTVNVWNFEGQFEDCVFIHNSGKVSPVLFSENGQFVASSCKKTIKIWNIHKRCEEFSIENFLSFSVAFSANSQRVVCYSQGFISVYSIVDHSEVFRVDTGVYVPRENWLEGGGRFAILKKAHEKYAVLDLEQKLEHVEFKFQYTDVPNFQCKVDNDFLVLISPMGIKFINLVKKQEDFEINCRSDEIKAYFCAQDEKYIVCASSCEYRLISIDLEKEREIFMFPRYSDQFTPLKFSRSGKYAASSTYSKKIQVWDVKSNTKILEFKGHSYWVRAISFSSDERFVVSGSDDCSLKIWSLEDKCEKFFLTGHTDWVSAVSFSDDGKNVVSASFDKNLKVWDLEKKSEAYSINIGMDQFSVAISRTKNYIASSDSITIRVWSAKNNNQPDNS